MKLKIVATEKKSFCVAMFSTISKYFISAIRFYLKMKRQFTCQLLIIRLVIKIVDMGPMRALLQQTLSVTQQMIAAQWIFFNESEDDSNENQHVSDIIEEMENLVVPLSSTFH